MPEIKSNVRHLVRLSERKRLEIDGALGILSFDQNCLVIELDECVMVVEGDSLKVDNMLKDERKLSVSGEITALFYDFKNGKNAKKRRR